MDLTVKTKNKGKIFSIENYDPYLSFDNTGIGIDYNLLVDNEGEEIDGSEDLWPIGKAAYDHLMEVRESDNENNKSPKEFIKHHVKEIFELTDISLCEAVDRGLFVDEEGVKGELLKAKIFNQDPLLRLSILLDFFNHLRQNEFNIWMFHQSGVFAIACLAEMDFIASLTSSTNCSTAQWVRLCCEWIEKMNIKIAIKEEFTQRSIRAAKSRHSETDSMKMDVLKIYNDKKNSYKSVAEAARILTKEVPVTHRTIEKWIRSIRT